MTDDVRRGGRCHMVLGWAGRGRCSAAGREGRRKVSGHVQLASHGSATAQDRLAVSLPAPDRSPVPLPAPDRSPVPLPAPDRPAVPLPTPDRPAVSLPAPDRPAVPLLAPDRPAVSLPAPDRPAVPLPAPDRPAMPLPAPDRPAVPLPAPDRPAVPLQVRRVGRRPPPGVHSWHGLGAADDGSPGGACCPPAVPPPERRRPGLVAATAQRSYLPGRRRSHARLATDVTRVRPRRPAGPPWLVQRLPSAGRRGADPGGSCFIQLGADRTLSL